MFMECSIVREYAPQYYKLKLRDVDELFLLQKVMKPTLWEFGYIPGVRFQRYTTIYLRSKPQYLVIEKP